MPPSFLVLASSKTNFASWNTWSRETHIEVIDHHFVVDAAEGAAVVGPLKMATFTTSPLD